MDNEKTIQRMRETGLAGESFSCSSLCSCGCDHPHVIARRETADGKLIHVWSDGDVTTSMGWGLIGIGRGRTAFSRAAYRQAALDIIDDVSLYTFEELPHIIHFARKLRLSGTRWSAVFSRRTFIRAKFPPAGPNDPRVPTQNEKPEEV